jgi:hypothetical protein
MSGDEKPPYLLTGSNIEVLRKPSASGKHRCALPENLNRTDSGWIIRCIECRRRWRATYQPPHQGLVGGMMWVRRYWPWPR